MLNSINKLCENAVSDVKIKIRADQDVSQFTFNNVFAKIEDTNLYYLQSYTKDIDDLLTPIIKDTIKNFGIFYNDLKDIYSMQDLLTTQLKDYNDEFYSNLNQIEYKELLDQLGIDYKSNFVITNLIGYSQGDIMQIIHNSNVISKDDVIKFYTPIYRDAQLNINVIFQYANKIYDYDFTEFLMDPYNLNTFDLELAINEVNQEIGSSVDNSELIDKLNNLGTITIDYN